MDIVIIGVFAAIMWLLSSAEYKSVPRRPVESPGFRYDEYAIGFQQGEFGEWLPVMPWGETPVFGRRGKTWHWLDTGAEVTVDDMERRG